MLRKSFFFIFLFLLSSVAIAQTYQVAVNSNSGKALLFNDFKTWFRLWKSTPDSPGSPVVTLKDGEEYNNMKFNANASSSIFLYSGRFLKKSSYILSVAEGFAISNLHFRARAVSVPQMVQFADTLITFDGEWQQFDFPQAPFQQDVSFVVSGSNTGLEVQATLTIESHPVGRIRYSVVDTLGNERAALTRCYPAGKEISSLPDSLVRDYVLYDYPSPCIVEADEERAYIVVSRDSLPFPPSAQGRYYLYMNGDWPIFADEKRLINTIEPKPELDPNLFLHPDLWEMSGDQYGGIYLRHVKTGLYLNRVIRDCHTCSYAILDEEPCPWHFCDAAGRPRLLDYERHTLSASSKGEVFLFNWGILPKDVDLVLICLVPAEDSER